MFKERRKYEKKVYPRLQARRGFIIDHLRKEWKAMEKAARREDAVRAVKAGGIAIGKGLLVLLLIAGTLTVAAMAPNVFSAFGRIRGRKSYRKSYRTYLNSKRFKDETAYLRRRGHIEMSKDETGEYKISLTKFGEQVVVQRAFSELKMLKPDKWDNVWRMIIFDIPNSHKAVREGFRERLKVMGFYPLQESVFVFPYPCYEELKFLSYIYNAADYVRYIETDKIVHDDDLCEYFSLG